MNTKNDIPSWMMLNDNYSPSSHKDSFIYKTSKSILKILSHFKSNSLSESAINPKTALCSSLFLIILTVASKNLIFPLITLTILVVYLAFLSARNILHILGNSLTGTLISLLFMLPAIIMGYYNTAILIIVKTCITVFFISNLNVLCSFNKIVHSLTFLHIPSIFILTLDITVKYIHILGNICLNMLNALKLRSVGVNNNKYSSMSGIMGTTFLKSQAYAKATHEAMICRGFDGEYKYVCHYGFGILDIIMVIYSLISFVLFLKINTRLF